MTRRIAAAAALVIATALTPLRAQQTMAPPKSSSATTEVETKSLPVGNGVLAGRVVVGGSGAPVRNARLALTLSTGERAVALTNGDGQFLFLKLPPGRFDVTVEKTGFLAGAFGRVRPGGPSQPLVLVENERRIDVTIELWRHASIAGVVIDDSGEPLIDVSLQIVRRTLVAGARRLAPGATIKTDDRGAYRFWGIEPGDYLVALPMNDRQEAIPDSNGAQTYPPMFYLEAATPSRATMISVASGEDRLGIDFVMRPVRSVRVAGTLSGPDGPSAHVPVTLAPADPGDLTSSSESLMAETDAGGAFAFSNVTSGQYTLQAIKMTTAADLAAPETRSTLTPAERFLPLADAPILWARASVVVGDTDVEGVSATLAPSPRVSGSIRFDGANPPIERLATLEIFLTPADGRVAAMPSRGPVKADGTFTTAGVLPGLYLVRVAGQIPGWYLRSAMLEGRDLVASSFDVLGGDMNGVVLTYTDRPSRVTGRALSADGTLAKTASVVFFPVDANAWSGSGSSPARERRVRVSDSGEYSVVNLPAGAYYAAALTDAVAADWNDPAVLDRLATLAVRVDVSDGRSVTRDLRVVALVR